MAARVQSVETGWRRFAAIDIGSNGMRLLIADANGAGAFIKIHDERAAVRLGHHTFTQGHLDPSTAERGIEALRAFKETADAFAVHRLRCVATSAVREASDGKKWARRVKQEVGVKVHVITGREEARLCHRAVRERIAIDEQPWMVMDLGGGSIELTIADHDRIHWCESRPLGTVRLLEAYDSENHDGFVERLHDHLDRFQILQTPDTTALAHLAAAGGNAAALAGMAGRKPSKENVRLSLDTVRKLILELEATTPEQRMETYGWRPDRADVILPAALVYERVATLFGAREIMVPDVGVKEGLALDMRDQEFDKEARSQALTQSVEESASALGRTFRCDENHHVHVARLALHIFDQLQELHDMNRQDRRILEAAALLHDVGKAVAQQKHHKHSGYIIANAEIGGLSTRATRMAAAVARYHRKAMPKPSHAIYRDLSTGDQIRVDKIAAILRVADALDKQHEQAIADVHCKLGIDELVLKVPGPGPYPAHEWALAKKSNLFARVFGRAVRMHVVPNLEAPVA